MKTAISRLMVAALCVPGSVPLLQGNLSIEQVSGPRLPVVTFVEPAFPTGVNVLGVTSGHAAVAITVDSSGKVVDLYSTEFSHRPFADAAIEAILSWEFEPDQTGSKLPRYFPVRVNFRMEGVILFITSVEDSKARFERLLGTKPIFQSFSIDNLDSIPEQTNAPLPKYPVELMPKRKAGIVEVWFFIDSSGKVRVPFVRQSDDPLFAEAALEAVRNWTFSAPKRNGQPVSAFAVQEFTFGPKPPMLN